MGLHTGLEHLARLQEQQRQSVKVSYIFTRLSPPTLFFIERHCSSEKMPPLADAFL